jgi:hypothetical protein
MRMNRCRMQNEKAKMSDQPTTAPKRQRKPKSVDSIDEFHSPSNTPEPKRLLESSKMSGSGNNVKSRGSKRPYVPVLEQEQQVREGGIDKKFFEK